jgi:hypothetical protein
MLVNAVLLAAREPAHEQVPQLQSWPRHVGYKVQHAGVLWCPAAKSVSETVNQLRQASKCPIRGVSWHCLQHF